MMLRQRRSGQKTTNESASHAHNSPTYPPPISRLTLSPTLISVIFGVVGFVTTTVSLLFVWASHQQDAPFHVTRDVDLHSPSSPQWEFYRYSGIRRNDTQSHNHAESHPPKHLMVQMSMFEDPKQSPDNSVSKYNEALLITSRVNKAYAKKWRVDYAKVTLPVDESTENEQYIRMLYDIVKIGLDDISNASNNQTSEYPYDLVWIFADPSMMTVNFEQNIFDYSDFLLTSLSQETNKKHDSIAMLGQGKMTNRHGIYKGALLWNLKHTHITNVLDSWERHGNLENAISSLSQTMQTPLWNTIIDDTSAFYHFPDEYRAMFRLTAADQNMEQREDLHNMIPKDVIKLQSVADLVCFRYFPSCDVL
jgi:hypothetical protein